MSDFSRDRSMMDTRLAELASLAGSAATLPGAAGIRRRARHRTVRRRVWAGALVVLALGAGVVGAWYARPAHRSQMPAITGTPRSASPSPRPDGSPSRGPAPGTASAATSAAAPSSTSRCTRADLSVTAGGTSAGLGHRSVALVFTNTSGRSCRLTGYPGVAALDAGGAQVAQARRTMYGYLGGLSGHPIQTVTLALGQSASALVEAMAANPDGSACTPYQGLLVTVPDDTVSASVPWGSDGCASLEVHPVVPGASGRSG